MKKNNSDFDYIEVGAGNQSKIIGQGNSISEYMATVFALGSYIVQGWLVAFTIVFLILGYYYFSWKVAALISFLFCTIVTVFGVWAVFKALTTMKGINEPQRPRDTKGRFRSAKVFRSGKHVGDIRTADTGETEYIERWGRGG